MTSSRAASEASPAIPQVGPWRRRWVVAVVVVLLGGGAAGIWWWQHRTPVQQPPAVPEDIRDPAVREAVETARQQVLARPRSADAWGSLGMTLLAYLYYEPADSCFAEAARLDPADASWPYYRAWIAGWIDPPAALPFLERAAEVGSPNAEEQATLRLQLADALLEQQRLDEAKQIYQEEVRSPANPRAVLGLGLVAAARGDTATARRHLITLQSSPWARKRATAQLALLSRRRAGEEQAAADYQQAAESLPTDADWPDPLLQAVFSRRVGRAQEMQDVAQLERQGRYREAAEVHLRRLEQEPGQARSYVGAGLDLVWAGDYDRALPLLRRATQCDPDNCVPYYQLAWALHRRAEAERQRAPDSAREWFLEAAAVAEQALQRKPDHADACLIRGRSLMSAGLPAEAVAPLQKGVLCRPESFDLQLALGEALLAAGRGPDAARPLERARQLDSKDPRLIDVLKRLPSGASGNE